MNRIQQLLIAAAAIATTTAARANDLFVIEATGGSNTVRLGGKSLIDLVDDAVNTRNAFNVFQSSDATFRLKYGNVDDAIVVTKNAANTQATLNLISGFTRTFTGANQQELEDQIRDFLKKDGGNAVKDFLRAMNERSVIAVSDGNPLATTARMANTAWERFGLNADQFRASFPTVTGQNAEPTAPESGDAPAGESGSALAIPAATWDKAPAQFRFRITAGRADADGFKGTTADAEFGMLWNFSKHVGLSLGAAIGFQRIEEAMVFHVTFMPALPIRILVPETSQPWSWQITPFGSGGGSGSVDIGAGGIITGGGVANHVGYNFTERFSLHMGNQIGFYRGNTLKFSDYELNPGVKQTIVKNGLQASFALREAPSDPTSGRWSLYAGASYTNLLDEAAVKRWLTPAAGIQRSWGSVSSIQLGFTGDIASNYKVYSGRLAMNFAF